MIYQRTGFIRRNKIKRRYYDRRSSLHFMRRSNVERRQINRENKMALYDELKKYIVETEWYANWADGQGGRCYDCHQKRSDGHTETCRRAAFISKIKKLEEAYKLVAEDKT